jgi:hypothetical protein
MVPLSVELRRGEGGHKDKDKEALPNHPPKSLVIFEARWG